MDKTQIEMTLESIKQGVSELENNPLTKPYLNDLKEIDQIIWNLCNTIEDDAE